MASDFDAAQPQFCTLCRNRCPLDNPKCPEVLTAEMREKLANRRAADDCCTLCQSHCPYTALRCELGRTTARIRGKLLSEAQ
ncbi:MAG: hypothetical protein LUG87_02485 [Oscillospiraceae bacterium]|nr:hypothetical protein [Oscillospiraceae bacterium]